MAPERGANFKPTRGLCSLRLPGGGSLRSGLAILCSGKETPFWQWATRGFQPYDAWFVNKFACFVN